MIPLHYMRWWHSISIDTDMSEALQSSRPSPAHVGGSSHLVLAGSAGCVLLRACWHKAIHTSACSTQTFMAAPGAEAASALCMTSCLLALQPTLACSQS